MEHTIKLKYGYQDKNGVRHRDVTFGKRLTVSDMISLDNDPRCQIPTQYGDLINSRMITKFGELPMPARLDMLLSLNSIDREDIEIGQMRFLTLGIREGIGEQYSDEPKADLAFGFDLDGTKYTQVTLDRLLTGKDEVEADSQGYRGITRECFLIGRRITQIATENGAATLDGPIGLDMFRKLDAIELNILRAGAAKADAMFRNKGESDESNGDAESGDGTVASATDPGLGSAGDVAQGDRTLPKNSKRAK